MVSFSSTMAIKQFVRSPNVQGYGPELLQGDRDGNYLLTSAC